ncbi:MAG: PilZ domain-containing protein [Gammaproteobacteria bacterium]|nr:PilZ domain-containing protein [Gammaproteobacteria bacterium]
MPSNFLQSDHERRACTRLPLAYAAVLESESGITIYGNTQDISLGGLLMRSQDDLTQLRPGEASHLALLLDNGERTVPYPCVITRIADDGVGIALDRKFAAAFGKQLTKGMFSR